MRGFAATGIATTDDAMRKRRVSLGEGMVTPVREVTVTYQGGRSEKLVPDLHRLDPRHTLVAQRPELFTLCCRDDRTTAPTHFRAMLARAERNVRRELGDPRALEQATSTERAPRRTYGRHQLRRKQQPPSRLR